MEPIDHSPEFAARHGMPASPAREPLSPRTDDRPKLP